MHYEIINPPKVSDAIVSQIEQLILEGVLKPGERLPPERELAQQLNVSRPSLREAMTTLKSRGLLQSRRGGGHYVMDAVSYTHLAHELTAYATTLCCSPNNETTNFRFEAGF